MNLIISTGCNKRCSFCFAHKNIEKKDYLSLEQFEEYLDFLENNKGGGINFTGGEPSLNPHLEYFIKETARRGFKASLISNLLFENDSLIETVNQFCEDIVANASEMSTTQFQIFKKNFDIINHKTTISLTLDESYKSDIYNKYIDFLFENLSEIRSVRTSLSLNQKGNFYFINNKELGKIIIHLYEKIGKFDQNKRWLTVECSTFPCMYESLEDFKKIKKVSYTSMGLECDCGVENNMTKYYSNYMADNLIRIESKKDLPIYSAQEIFQSKLRDIKKNLSAPKVCKSCQWFKDECYGPCYAFYKEEDFDA